MPIFVGDSSSGTGAGLSIAFNAAGLVGEYRRQGQATWTPITLTSATLGTWTSGGWIADGSLIGAYEVGIPNAALASGARWVAVRYYGATNMVPCLNEIEIDAVDYQDAAGFGLSRLDAAMTTRLSTAGYTAPDNATIASIYTTVDTEIAAIKTKTDNLPASPAAVGSPMVLSALGLDAVVIETGVNARQALSGIFSAAAGVLSGAGTGSITIRGGNVGTTRIVATTDSSGNRSAMALTLPT